MQAGTVEQKDIVIALFGSSLVLTGLLLVFQGFLGSGLSGLADTADRSLKTSYGRLIWSTTGAFVLSILTSALGLLWLLWQQLFALVVIAFVLTLIVVLILGLVTTKKVAK